MRRYGILGASILMGFVLVVWLNAWLIGSAVMIGAYAKLHGPDLWSHWWQEWVKHPLTSAWAILRGTSPADAEMRQLWLLAQIPLGCLIAYLAYIWTRSIKSQPHKAANYGSHGTADFDTTEALSRRCAADGPGLIIGRLQTGRLSKSPIRWLIHSAGHALNQFVLLLGSAGSFKTTSYILLNTLHEQETSLVLADPKGEVYRKTAKVKESQGYAVRVINYDRMDLSSHQNPLDYVRRPEDAVAVANVVIHNTDNPSRPAAGDDFFDRAEQALMTALILYVKLHRPPTEHNFASILALGTELTQEELNALFDDLPREAPARKYYRTFRQAEDKTRACILLGFANRLQLWNLESVEQLTAGSDFPLATMGREKTCLYVILPMDARLRALAPLMALLWTQLCDELVKLANTQPDGQLPVPVRFRLDEAANIGHIPDLELRVSTTRGLGIWWELVFQTLGQLKGRYRAWAEIAGSCDTTLFLGGNDPETLEYISRRLGATTIQVQSAHQSRHQTGSTEGEGASYMGRQLMTPDELGRLTETRAVLMQRGRRPALVDKPYYRDHPSASHIEERHANDVTPLAPIKYKVINPPDLPPVKALNAKKEQAEAARQRKPKTREMQPADSAVEGISSGAESVSIPSKSGDTLAFLKRQTRGG